jgi:NADH-quinone oxidoreductase subunit L
VENSYLGIDGFVTGCFILAIVLPLASGLFSFVIPEKYSWLTVLNAPFLLLVASVCSVIVVLHCWNNPSDVIVIDWLAFSDNRISANLHLSNSSVFMSMVVSCISFLVHLYSVGYMAGDGAARKYFGLLGFFTFAMLGVVYSDNLLVLFIFWELVGFSSYLLIGHWNDNAKAANAATKAFIMNRIGYVAFLAGLMIIWSNVGSFEISLFSSAPFEWQTAAGLCVFAGVIGKSAQFPLFTWLPDAMQGPTPVSALIHAATMVAAGVYLLFRLFPIFDQTTLTIIAIIGAITALLASVSALFQTDIKKVLAYSTISQLGLMILTIGMGGRDAALLHLFTHAFFKAGLFLCAGLIIHSLQYAQARSHQHFDAQDLRNLGGLNRKLPITFICFLFCGASLAGLPFFSGFLSKEAMYGAILAEGSTFSWIMLVVTFIVSVFTALYTFRMFWFIFMGESRIHESLDIREGPIVMRVPVIILAACSSWLLVSWNPINFNDRFLSGPHHALPAWAIAASIALTIVSLAIAFAIFKRRKVKVYQFFEENLKIDALYKLTFVNGTVHFSNFVWHVDKKIIDGALHASAYGHVILAHVVGWFDRVIIDGAVDLCSGIVRWVGGVVRSYQSGKVQDYILWAIIALIIFIIWTL